MEITVSIDSRGALLRNGVPMVSISVPSLRRRQYLFLPVDEMSRLGGCEGLLEDFLLVAGSCYVIDQLVPRASFPDNWTRELEVTLPVSDPSIWSGLSLRLSQALTFLTGDRWTMVFTEGHLPAHSSLALCRLPVETHLVPAVSLFSGGLDSLVGVVDELCESGEPLALVGHYDVGSVARMAQRKLYGQLVQRFGGDQVHLFQGRIGRADPLDVTGDGSALPGAYGLETTYRSRSLVFIALGLFVARKWGRNDSVPLLVPENGLIALNPPLTPSRLGSCSTRTAHPFFLARLEALIRGLGMENSITNPFAGKTKGQLVAASRDLPLVTQLAADTISCAHPTRRMGWIRRDATHCGYCIPCIFRRAALHRVGLDRGYEYGYDVCAGELDLDREIASDLRAVLTWISDARAGLSSPTQQACRLTLPPDQCGLAASVIEAGLDEVARLFLDRGVPAVVEWAGLE